MRGSQLDAGGTRRHDLDWVRALAILSVVSYHAAQVFSGQADGVNAREVSRALREFCYFFHQWRMPLVFCIAGASTWMVLQRRTAREYARGRARRVLVPLVFGVLVLLPPFFYTAWRATESFVSFYPRFIDAMFGGRGLPDWGHLWFLVHLVLADALALCVLVLVGRLGGRRVLERAAGVLARPAAIFALALPLAAVRSLPSRWVGDWTVLGLVEFKPFVLDLTFYALGYLLASSASSWDAMVRRRGTALCLALTTQVPVYALRAVVETPGAPHLGATRALEFVSAMVSWFWVIAVFGYARHHLLRENALLRYLRDAAYPLYLLHFTVLTVIAAPFARSDAPVAVRFLALTVATTALSFGLYEAVIKRTAVTRFLFGLVPRTAAGRGGRAAAPTALPEPTSQQAA